jgi:hypothetical protein
MATLPSFGTSLPRRALAACLVAAVAIALRFWRLGWGLDHGLCFPDEQIFWGVSAPRFVPLSWSSFAAEELPYPTLYRTLAGLATALAAALGALEADTPSQLEGVFIARVVSAAAGVATALVLGLLAGRLYGPRVGLSAAALWAVLPLEVVQAHIASVDVVLALACAGTLFASYELARRGRLRDAALAGAAAGLAAGAKYTGVVMAASVAWALAEAAWRDRSPRRLLACTAAALGGAVVAAFLACPSCALRPDVFVGALRWFRFINEYVYASMPNAHLVPSLGWYGRPWLYPLVASLPYALGWPVYLLALLGLASAVRGRGMADRVLLGAFLPAFLAIGSANVTYPRYLLPLCPALLILAARFGAGASLPRPRLRAAAFAAAWLYTALLAASQVARTSYDQQVEVARWLASALGPRSARSVGVPEFARLYYRLCEPLRVAGLECVPIADDAWLAAPTDVIAIPRWYEIAMRRDHPGGAADTALAKIAAGETSYREVGRWRSNYLQQALYVRLDPAFEVELTQGSAGFTIYARDRARTALSVRRPPRSD